MKTERIYIADDGTRFDDYFECYHYELSIYEKRYADLKDYCQYYDSKGKPIPYARVAQGATVYYAHFDKVPNEHDDIYERFVEALPEGLEDDCTFGGWFVYFWERWHEWSSLSAEFEEYIDTVKELSKGE
jgi:hypothetical protein